MVPAGQPLIENGSGMWSLGSHIPLPFHLNANLQSCLSALTGSMRAARDAG